MVKKTLLSFINYNNNFYNILFYLNNRIFKYLGKDKGIEAFIFIRTLYRASNILMDNYKNYFYSYYYVKLAEIIKDKSKIDKESIILLLKCIASSIDKGNPSWRLDDIITSLILI